MDQKSDEWLEWRKEGIGSSDAPIIMLASPWSTPYELWKVKTGRTIPDSTSNWAQERGNELEPIARAKFELESGIDMPAKLCQHMDFPWLRASLDGANDEERVALEIKYLGVNDMKLAEAGHLPPKYFPQIQHQFLVTGYEKIFFYGYNVPAGAEKHMGKSVMVECSPDPEYIEKLFRAEQAFWARVLEDIAPSFIKQDYKMLKVKGAKALAVEYMDLLKMGLSGPEKRMGEIREELFSMGKDIERFWIADLKSEVRNGTRTLELASWGRDGISSDDQ